MRRTAAILLGTLCIFGLTTTTASADDTPTPTPTPTPIANILGEVVSGVVKIAGLR
ncbi:hypothetical protein ACFYMW_39880 [Streptomyces sp. NPDC006692]|uniref:hypothetical protein n=1 Tax=Streptomyces sp. NPDC006692 TaxID=3364758 RepID=UPI0036AAA9B0